MGVSVCEKALIDYYCTLRFYGVFSILSTHFVQLAYTSRHVWRETRDSLQKYLNYVQNSLILCQKARRTKLSNIPAYRDSWSCFECKRLSLEGIVEFSNNTGFHT